MMGVEGRGFSRWHRQLIFTLAGFLKELNLVYTKHMKCILSRSFTCSTCSERISFDAATSIHQQRHSEERIVVWHFQLIAWYQVSFVHTCSSSAFLRSEVKLWTFITPAKRLQMIFPVPLLQHWLCWFDAMYMHQYYITWLSAWMTALSNTHFALRNVTYQVPIVRERQLRWCHSYFMLLLLKKNSPLTQTPRQSTFKLLTVKSCSCMRISYTLYLTLQSLFWMTTINFLPQDWPFKYLSSF